MPRNERYRWTALVACVAMLASLVAPAVPSRALGASTQPAKPACCCGPGACHMAACPSSRQPASARGGCTISGCSHRAFALAPAEAPLTILTAAVQYVIVPSEPPAASNARSSVLRSSAASPLLPPPRGC